MKKPYKCDICHEKGKQKFAFKKKEHYQRHLRDCHGREDEDE